MFDGSFLEQCHLLVKDANMLHLELSLWFNLNHIPINYMIRIMYTLLKQRNMKNIANSHVSKQCNPICNWSYPIKDFKWPTIFGWQFGTTSQLQRTILWLYSQINMILDFKLFVHSFQISVTSLPILGFL